MKFLRLIYLLLSLTIVDLGWLILRLAFVFPAKFVLSPLVMLIGGFILLTGALTGIVCLILLVWSIIAYAPQPVQVSTEKIKSALIVLLLFIAFNGTAHYILRPHPNKSQIVFNDSTTAVRDSMKVLRQLCESVEANQFLSCFVQSQDRTLFFSVPITRNLESLTTKLGRIDTVTSSNAGFKYMKKEDVTRLLLVLKFLNRNQIAGIVHDVSIGFWQYPYDMEYHTENQWFGQDKQTNRYLYMYDSPEDTASAHFNYYLRIKARKEHLVLVETNDVRYRIFR